MSDLTVSGSIDSFMSLTDASAVRFVKFNADNTVSLRSDSDMRADLGLVIGTNVQAYDADLASWAGVTRGTGFDTAAAIAVNTAGGVLTHGGAGAHTTLTASGTTTLTAGTASSSTTTGTLVVTGGVGVSGTINAAALGAGIPAAYPLHVRAAAGETQAVIDIQSGQAASLWIAGAGGWGIRSGATGLDFKTGNPSSSTSRIVFGATGSITASGTIITTPDTRNGAGAISVTTLCTKVTSTGAAQALTLANGTDGQIKTIIHDVDGGDWILTPTTATGYTTISSSTAGDSATLQYVTTRGWIILSLRGATAA